MIIFDHFWTERFLKAAAGAVVKIDSSLKPNDHKSVKRSLLLQNHNFNVKESFFPQGKVTINVSFFKASLGYNNIFVTVPFKNHTENL